MCVLIVNHLPKEQHMCVDLHVGFTSWYTMYIHLVHTPAGHVFIGVMEKIRKLHNTHFSEISSLIAILRTDKQVHTYVIAVKKNAALFSMAFFFLFFVKTYIVMYMCNCS